MKLTLQKKTNIILKKVEHTLSDKDAFWKTVQRYTGIKKKYDKIVYPANFRNRQPKKPFVATCTELGFHGELGNQMFQIAAVVGYARKYNFKAKLPYWYCRISQTDYAQIFQASFDQSLKSRDLYGAEKFDYQELEYKEVPQYSCPVDFDGFFQSEKYFEHCSGEIRSFFQPRRETETYIKGKYADLLKIKDKVCLHVRTGKRIKNDYSGHNYASAAFIEKGMSFFSPDDLYVIFSDKMDAAKEMLPKDKKYFFVEGEKNYVDLCLMMQFEKYIISPSTFGWWGAWLSKTPHPKIVIEKDWFNPNGSKAHLNQNNIIPDTWTKI